MTNRTCLNCGWVHFAVTCAFAEDEVARFNAYYANLTSKEQQDWYGGHNSSIKNYEKCFRCSGPYTNFRESKDGDCPDGCTLNPIIHE